MKMTTDSTVARMGRLMKICDTCNPFRRDAQYWKGRASCGGGLLGLQRDAGSLGSLFVFLALVRLFNGDLHPRPHALDPGDNHAFPRLDARLATLVVSTDNAVGAVLGADHVHRLNGPHALVQFEQIHGPGL